ncbi:MAG: hypothetical protein KGQ60_18460, partial [Planctomycetes bacterium]|nr:hypothetical protein [Planctomycetota bacterium]
LLGQLFILGFAAIKGYLSPKTVTQIVALLNGIDIQGERLTNAIKEGKNAPVPTYQDVLEAKSNAILSMDSRAQALDRYKRQLDEKDKSLTEREARHNALVAEFKKQENETRAAKETESLQLRMQLFSALQPPDAKQQLMLMLEKNLKSDVISILKGLDDDKLKKILGEFTELIDQQKIADIMEEIRQQGKSANVATK